MSAIDKIFGTVKQYDELHTWVRNNYPDELISFNWSARAKEGRGEKSFSKGASIALFTEDFDCILIVECPFQWVREQLVAQYSIIEYMRGDYD